LNIVDYIILGIILISVIFGLRRGFISGVLSLGSLLLSVFIAFQAYPTLAQNLQSNESLVNTLVHYTDASSRIKDLELALTPVSSLTQEALDRVMENAGLPAVFDTFVRQNVAQQAFSAIGSVNISEYLNQTIISVSLNILCFIICFAVAYIAFSLLSHMICYVFRLPVLRHLDALAGGLFGALRGVIIVFVLSAIVPIILTISPIEQVQQLIETSQLAGIFLKDNMIASIMQGTIGL
jgi:hypothetical protein